MLFDIFYESKRMGTEGASESNFQVLFNLIG